MAKINDRFDSWKNKLLDLGKRNRLINYKETKSSTLRITHPSIEELFERLVRKEEELAFPRPFDEEDVEDAEQLTLLDFQEEDEYGNSSSAIRTNKKITDLQKVLRKLRNKAKTANEEQGINILFACFGFLNWTESDSAHTPFSSPLILVPITLSVESIISPFVMSLHEDEIVVNPTLAYKLSHDYGIDLPAFDENRPLEEYFKKVQSIVQDQKWTVQPKVGISLLSFLKINMYEDLNRHKDSILVHPVVRALGGDPSALPQIPSDLIEYDYDRNDKPESVFQIVDADSSQQEAILLAKKGISFILQGPPGTGKSQTITNIIAECLASGKKVLFVSEKMAALEVVHKRLSAAGLDDFCLVLHSHRANKRAVLDQLEHVLLLSKKKAKLDDEAFRKLSLLCNDRTKLNDYAEQVYEPIAPLNRSIYDANGIISSLLIYEDVIFPIKDIRYTSRDMYDRYLTLLEQFASTIGKMTDDYRNNPWRGATMSAVTNEFRHDANAKLPELIDLLKETNHFFTSAKGYAFSYCKNTVEGMAFLEQQLETAKDSFEIPAEWILNNAIPPESEIDYCVAVQERTKRTIEIIKKDYESLSQVETISLDASMLFDPEVQIEHATIVTNALQYGDPYFRWSKDSYDKMTNLLSAAKQKADEIISLRTALFEEYEPGILDIDYIGIENRYKVEYTSVFKWLKKQYKQDRATILINRKSIGGKLSDDEILSVIQRIKTLKKLLSWYNENYQELNQYFGQAILSEYSDYSSIEIKHKAFKILTDLKGSLALLQEITAAFAEQEETIRQHFGYCYSGILTDWGEVRKARSWAFRFQRAASVLSASPEFIRKVCESKDYAQGCLEQLKILRDQRACLEEKVSWFTKHFDNPDAFRGMTFIELRDRVSSCLNNFFQLEEWIDYRVARDQCNSEGLGDYLKAIEEKNIAAKDIVPIFKKRFFRLWLDSVLPEYPAVQQFRRKVQEGRIQEFGTLDKEQFSIARSRIRSKLINDLPSTDHYTTGLDEIGILKRELSKQRKIMPIRRLFAAIPNLLVTLKPCLMMSPLSVSLFLESDSYQFDTVIFDEASQVYTENAIGAISRGKQAIIAGDRKQLPPTSFFQTATASDDNYDDDDEDEDYEVYDSILDEANLLPERSLEWHYRSKHESLIAFSNAKIYNSHLITFPSNIENGKNTGVEFVRVPGGYYDRGGRNGNPVEAKKVAELVFNHFQETPERSLGVIAFGEKQQIAIEAALREMRLANQEYEDFFSEEKEDAFFVKSLENVQGDERDTIIFSIGYAPDASGAFKMNFGPLGKAGGERRLNVAITRAKLNVKLVGSFLPTDINVDSISTEGPKLLRAYMDYAINGPSVIANAIDESDVPLFDSPFEESVYRYLDREGYKVSTQVGCSGYRIDLGIKHPTISGVYVLGIECDGAAYHSAKTARERDRLRQDVLEGMGWKIYRIWSTDWIKDPVTEGKLLSKAIEEAIASYHEEPPKAESKQLKETKEYLNLSDETSTSNISNPYGFDSYKPTALSRIIARGGSNYLRECLIAVVTNEYPIHIELLCQRVAHLFGNEKATIKVRREVEWALRNIPTITRKGDYLYPAGYKEIRIKLPNFRKIQHISTEELATAMLQILKTYIGANRKALTDETSRVYGFTRTGQNISIAMNEAVDYLIRNKLVEEVEGKLRIRK